MTDLSILIPSRNEMFLARTIQDILQNARGDTEIIAVLDGEWADPPIQMHPRVSLVYFPQSIGQRAATNVAARISTAKYLMKVDAHCAFDEGFDVKMMADMQPDWTMIPVMRNLHAFDWVCPNGHRRYQGPSGPCKECGEPTTMDVVWIAKSSPQSTSYRFDKTMHFQYFGEYKRKQVGDLVETMSIQGSCFMLTREKYLELDICDERHGSWGQQGVEVACKTWLSGGRVIVNKKTWYAHMFRTQGADFGFPYPNLEIEKAREYSRDMWLNNKWDKAIHPLSWLIDKFAPVPGWEEQETPKTATVEVVKDVPVEAPSEKEPTKGVLYYTDNRIDETIMRACQTQIKWGIVNVPLVSVSLKPIDFGYNITLQAERGYLTMFKQILAGLQALNTDIVFFCEHDVLYHPLHFDFVPSRRRLIYYNTNVWRVRYPDGHALYTNSTAQTSGLCAYRETLIEHYKKRVEHTQAQFDQLGECRAYRNWIRKQGFEPGSHHRPERVDDLQHETWFAAKPNIDIRHDKNLTPSRWSKDQFINQRNTRGWTEAECVEGWYEVGEFAEFINGLGRTDR